MNEMAKKILIVEDDKNIADSLCLFLKEQGYQTDAVYDGKEAIPKVKDYEPDLILLDIMLPGTDGFEICKSLKGSEATMPIPILMLTARDKTEDIIKGLDAGADDYITKPFSLAELSARVKSHLRAKEMYDDLEIKKRDEEILLGMTRKVSSSLDPKNILHTIAKKLAEMFQLERCSVVYINREIQHGYVMASHECPDFKEIELDLSKYPEIIKTLKERHEVIINDVSKELEFSEIKAILNRLKIKAIAVFPIFFDDDIVGTLILRTIRDHEFSEREIGFFEVVANIVANPLRNAYLFSMVRDESNKERVLREQAERSVKKIDDSLRESEEKYRKIVELSPNAIVIHTDGKFVFANSAALKLLGIEKIENLIGKPIMDFVHPDYKEEIKERIGRILNEGETAPLIEEKFITSDGRTIIAEVTGTSIIFDGKPSVQVVIRDISERKRLENTLKESELRYRRLFEKSPLGILIIDAETAKIIEFNEAACSQLGYSMEEFANLHIYDFEAVESPAETQEHIKKLLREGHHTFETLHRTKAGEIRNIIVIAQLIELSGKKFLLSIFYDITERKKAEEKLRRTEYMIDRTSDGVYWVGPDARILSVNNTACKSLGYTREELLSMTVYDISPDFTPDIWEKHWEDLKNRRSFTIEAQGKTRDGKIFPVDVMINYVRFENKEYNCAFVRDITERKRTENELRQAQNASLNIMDDLEKKRKELEDMNLTLEKRVKEEVEKSREKDHLLIHQSRFAAMGEMLNNIAHQWRQPLNTTGLIIQNIRDAYKYGELNKEYLDNNVDKAMKVIHNMSKTIDDFRNFFKPEKVKEEFSLKNNIGRTIYLVEAAYESIGIKIKFSADEDITVVGYPNEYSHTIMNILGNAGDVIIEKKIENPQIVMRLFRENDRGVATITDNAGGVSEDIIDKIFNPYFTTKEQGMGIGLYMSKIIIEKNMGGRLTVRNIKGGAEFRIEIPLKYGGQNGKR